MKRATTVRKLIVIGILGAIAGCSGGEQIATAEKGIPHFRELIVAKKYDQIYEESAAELRQSASRDQLTDIFKTVERNLGAFKSSEKGSWRINYQLNGPSVGIALNSVFERGAATETFSFRIENTKAVLIGYYIRNIRVATHKVTLERPMPGRLSGFRSATNPIMNGHEGRQAGVSFSAMSLNNVVKRWFI